MTWLPSQMEPCNNLLMVLDFVFWYQPPSPFVLFLYHVFRESSIISFRGNDVHSLPIEIEFPPMDVDPFYLTPRHQIRKNNSFEVSFERYQETEK